MHLGQSFGQKVSHSGNYKKASNLRRIGLRKVSASRTLRSAPSLANTFEEAHDDAIGRLIAGQHLFIRINLPVQ